MEGIMAAIYAVLEADHPMTVRQCFYALTVRGVIEKTEAEYNGTVVRLLTRMRRARIIPYSWISDNTRWMRKATTYRSLKDFVDNTARFYRRDLWATSNAYVEIWCEKDALAGVIMDETIKYDVPLMVSRGFSSDTYLQSAAAHIIDVDKPAFIYQFGDHDPSGILVTRQIEEGFRRHAPDAEIYFERIAVTPEQIADWDLPSHPTKREGNRHARDFEGDSVELDAIPASDLRELVRDCIERHTDQDEIDRLGVAEESERELIRVWAEALGGAQ